MTNDYTGREILMRTLIAEQVRYVFGNPGTTELPLMEGLIDHREVEYILCLHEAVAVTMADAYAQATGQVGFVNLHIAPGLGNGLGSIYNAWEGRTPLVITAGQHDTRLRLREPLLGHDLVAMAAPLTKWSVEAHSADELPLILHRAFKTARDTPSGPVFVSLPMNVMEETTREPPRTPARTWLRTPPEPAGIAQAASLLAAARNPLILCGDKVATSGAVPELVAVSEALGAAVDDEVLPARVNFPNRHPHYRGRIARDQRDIRERLAGHDVILMVGGDYFEEIWYTDADPFPEGSVRIQIDPDPGALARNYAVDCAILADLKPALSTLTEHLASHAEESNPALAATVAQRGAALAAAANARREAQAQRAAQAREDGTMSAARLMSELAACLPVDAAIAAEPITASPDVVGTLEFRGGLDYLASRGGGIGQGLPSAIGLKLACPERPVLAVSGDGSALYTTQALWTAAHHDIPVVFLILNNGAYRILKLNTDRYRADYGLPGDRGYPHMDLADPPVDFVSLARGYGVEGRRIERPEDVAPAIEAAFGAARPYLLDVVIGG